MRNWHLKVEHTKGYKIMRLAGVFEQDEALFDAIVSTHMTSGQNLILNLEGVVNFTSKFLAQMSKFIIELLANDCKVRLVSPTGRAKRLFDKINMLCPVEVFECERDACC